MEFKIDHYIEWASSSSSFFLGGGGEGAVWGGREGGLRREGGEGGRGTGIRGFIDRYDIIMRYSETIGFSPDSVTSVCPKGPILKLEE